MSCQGCRRRTQDQEQRIAAIEQRLDAIEQRLDADEAVSLADVIELAEVRHGVAPLLKADSSQVRIVRNQDDSLRRLCGGGAVET